VEIAMTMLLLKVFSLCSKQSESSARYTKRGMRHGPRYSITSSFITTQNVAMEIMVEYLQWSLKNSIMRSCQLSRKLGACHEVSIDEETLTRYVGVYELTPEFHIDVFVEDGTLFLQATGQPKNPLAAKSETEFFFKGVPIGILFQLSDGEKTEVTGLLLKQSGTEQLAKKIQYESPPSDRAVNQ
jgi:hypothetical protein